MRGGMTYKMEIYDTFGAQELGNRKYVKFTELSSFGGKNYFLAGFFFAAACLVLAIILFFFFCYFTKLHRGANRDDDAFINSLSY